MDIRASILQAGAFTRQQAEALLRLLGTVVGADWNTNLDNIPANIDAWALIDPVDKFDTPAGTAAQYLRGDGSLGSLPVDPGYITGFSHRTTVANALVSGGTAYVPSVARNVTYAGGTVGGTIPNGATLHVYLHANGTVNPSLTAPAPPYAGTARHMTGNDGTRYLFSVRSQLSGGQLYLQQGVSMGDAMDVTFLHNVGINSVIANFNSTSVADLSGAPWAPADVTSGLLVRARPAATGTGVFRFYCYTGSSFSIYANVIPLDSVSLLVPCDSEPKIVGDVTNVDTVTPVWLLGYRIQR